MKLSLIILLTVFIVTLNCFTAQLYFITDKPVESVPKVVEELRNNNFKLDVLYIVCEQRPFACEHLRVKKEGFPQLVFWPGPGKGFKHLGVATVENMNKFFDEVAAHPLHPLRNFIQKLTFPQAMGMAFVIIFLLHFLLFSNLFKNRAATQPLKAKPQ